MLEQWEADRLLRARKVYTFSTTVDLRRGADNDYQVETDDGSESLLLDVRGPGRNPAKARFQLRHRRTLVLARLCLMARHTNPDGERLDGSHLHLYREGFDARYAENLSEFDSIIEALTCFCERVNLPVPDTQEGLR
jgi:hypothetical protein